MELAQAPAWFSQVGARSYFPPAARRWWRRKKSSSFQLLCTQPVKATSKWVCGTAVLSSLPQKNKQDLGTWWRITEEKGKRTQSNHCPQLCAIWGKGLRGISFITPWLIWAQGRTETLLTLTSLPGKLHSAYRDMFTAHPWETQLCLSTACVCIMWITAKNYMLLSLVHYPTGTCCPVWKENCSAAPPCACRTAPHSSGGKDLPGGTQRKHLQKHQQEAFRCHLQSAAWLRILSWLFCSRRAQPSHTAETGWWGGRI